MTNHMQFGLATFADMRPGETPEQRMRALLEEVVLADQLGLDVFGIGEHHRADYAVSSPIVALAVAAGMTSRIRLTSAVTVLGSADPVRVFEEFASLDLLSGGRAEVMAGRGSFTESFRLFGLDLDDYASLFASKLHTLLHVRDGGRVNGMDVHPRPARRLPVWVAVGGTPESFVRAGQLGLPLAIAVLGGRVERFRPHVERYREAAAAAGHDPAALEIAVNGHAFVGATREEADAAFREPWLAMMAGLGRERGWPPIGRDQYDAYRAPGGALLVGAPDEVAEKILHAHDLFGSSRYVAQMSVGAVPHADVMRSIERFAGEVVPLVRAELARRDLRAA